MANIKNFNFNKFDFHISKSDYWDLFLALDEGDSTHVFPLPTGSCQVVWIDFNNPNIFDLTGDTIHSLTTWTGATNSGYTFNTIGLTGIDNGLITFEKLSADTTNQALLSALTGSTLVIPSGDTRMFMNPVSGMTGEFIYPIDLAVQTGLTFSSFTYSNFCGGFYQGFYKIDGYAYQVLPVRVEHSWSAEFILKPTNTGCTGTTATTGTTGSTGTTGTTQILNDVYTGNTGFFFYMGTRAENKFWNQWHGNNTGCTSACTIPDSACTDTVTEFCTIPKEFDISLIGDYGVPIPLDPPQVTTSLITNGFLIYGRGGHHVGCTCGPCSGPSDGLGNRTVCDGSTTGVVVTHTAGVPINTTNGFLIYGRGRGGASGCTCQACMGPMDGFGNQTVCSFTGRGFSAQTEIDYRFDEFDNALGFRITPDGRIGYRLLTYTAQCIDNVSISGLVVEEGYSEPNIVSGDVWSYVVIKFTTNFLTECELEFAKPRKGRLSFYVNGYLKYFVDDFDEFIARRLMEYKDKQIAVPFNFSLGGGSQGLLESMTFDGQDPHDLGLAIEKYFAGTFIGGIAQFRYNICDLGVEQIRDFLADIAPIYGIPIKTHGNC